MPLPIPHVLLWTLGALGAVALFRLAVKANRHANDELERVRAASMADQVERTRRPTLRRDPRSGIYRP